MSGERRQRIYYVVADYLSTNLALLLFNVFRYYDLDVANKGFFTLGNFLASPMLVAGQIAFPVYMMGVYYLSGFYSPAATRSRTWEFSTTFVTALIGTVSLIFAVLINDLTTDRRHDYLLFLMLMVILFGVVYIPRLLITMHGIRKIRRGRIFYNTAIVGYGSHPELFDRQRAQVNYVPGLRVTAYVDAENGSGGDTLSDIDDIVTLCAKKNIERIVVIPHPAGWESTLGVLDRLFMLGIPVYIAAEGLPPYMFSAQLAGVTADPFIDISRTHMSASTINIKRAIDVAVSALMIGVAAVPVSLMCLAIMIDSKGSPIYTQLRVGRDKRKFRIIKLRTMRTDSEHGGPELSHPGDPRVTRLGHFLRRYHIDELPQFINVLKGDMSLVGPRPERPHFIELILRENPSYTLIHRVRPGITSLGMVKYGYASTVEDMVKRLHYDLLYLQNISLTNDMKIILHTFNNVLSGKGV
ncbi:MAG: exopolysaccharide biosynthesis polyprenyl glycosylphosphotransferase [Paramuribaculum sp.]|nr:exopolysaccharide biosynthesis polyprenyl glycosylphosphotransferase [Paramuribaculum sp.]